MTFVLGPGQGKLLEMTNAPFLQAPSIFEQRCIAQEKVILQLRQDLHWARIAFTVARSQLTQDQRTACDAEIKRQAAMFKVGNERIR